MISKDLTAIVASRRRFAPRRGSGQTGSWMVSIDLDAQRWSPEMYEIFGVSPAFVPTPEALLDLIHPGDLSRVRKEWAHWRSTGEPFSYPLRIIRPDGEPRALHVRGWVHLEDGSPLRAVGTTRDITNVASLDRGMLASQQAALLESVSDGLCALDAGRIVFANDAARGLLGSPDTPIEGCTLHELVHRNSEHAPGSCPYARVSEGHTSGVDTEFVRADGTPVTVEYVIATDAAMSVVSFRRPLDGDDQAALLRRSEQRAQTLLTQRDRLLQELATAEERERLRIAADLHDDTIQALRAVALELQTTSDNVIDDDARRSLAAAGNEILAAATRLRHQMFDLMPPSVDGDLGVAIDAYCRMLFADTDVRWEVTGSAGSMRPNTYIVAYRLAQEALRNVRRHAHAARARIELDGARHTVVIRILDDGVGWGEHQPGNSLNGGMRLIDERARSAGGWARPGLGLGGRGASIEFLLPRDGLGSA